MYTQYVEFKWTTLAIGLLWRVFTRTTLGFCRVMCPTPISLCYLGASWWLWGTQQSPSNPWSTEIIGQTGCQVLSTPSGPQLPQPQSLEVPLLVVPLPSRSHPGEGTKFHSPRTLLLAKKTCEQHKQLNMISSKHQTTPAQQQQQQQQQKQKNKNIKSTAKSL